MKLHTRLMARGLGAWMLAVLPTAVLAEHHKVLSACAGHTPPFVQFFDGNAIGGFSVELVQQVSKLLGLQAQIQQLPWARCLQLVKLGKVDVAIDAYDDAERRKSFRYSTAYYTLTPQVFYRAADAVVRPDVFIDRNALTALRGCGVRGYTYDHYGIDASTMDLGAENASRMLMKLKAGHCDYALEEMEYIMGARQSGAQWLDESPLQSFQPVWAKGPKLHFLIGKERADGARLLKSLDNAIAVVKDNGFLSALQRRYFDKTFAKR